MFQIRYNPLNIEMQWLGAVAENITNFSSSHLYHI